MKQSLLQRIVDSWPGQKTFGVYRFLPLFFALGASLEFSMIKWTVGQTNFCELPYLLSLGALLMAPLHHLDHTFKQRKAKEIVAERLAAQAAQVSQ